MRNGFDIENSAGNKVGECYDERFLKALQKIGDSIIPKSSQVLEDNKKIEE